jgi:hypothetical protein
VSKISFRSSWVAALVFTILLTAGCSSFSKVEQPQISLFHSLDTKTTIGQTSLARYDGLHSVSVYLQPEIPGNGDIRLTILDSPTSELPLAQAAIAGATVSQPDTYTFTFPPLANTTLKDIYFLLEYGGNGRFGVGIAPGNLYLNGALYINQNPQDAQIFFSMGYHPVQAALGIAKEGLTWLAWLIAMIFLFVLPGWALLMFSWPGWSNLDWTTKLGLSTGASLPLYPLWMVWTDLLGANLGKLYAWLLPGAALVVLLWSYFFDISQRRREHRVFLVLTSISQIILRSTRSAMSLTAKKMRLGAQKDRFSPGASLLRFDHTAWANLAFLLVLGIIIAIRLWAVRGLDYPMFGDSYQHTVITQLLIDNNGLFNSWQPYAEMTTLSYHFGFHSLAAVFHWLANIPAPKAVLLTGQLINILAAISLVPLATRLGRTPWAGVLALLLAGLLFQMPNFYLNWGRYPQLAGQTILASLTWLMYDWLERPKPSRASTFSLCLLLAGLAITHYRVIIMAMLFLLAYWFLHISKSSTPQLFWKSTTLGIGALMLCTPWFIRAFSSDLFQWLQNKLRGQVLQNANASMQLEQFSNLGAYIPAFFWLIFLFCVAWSLWRREKGTTLISLWWLLILIAANPHWLNLPSEDILDSFAVLIAAYFPAAILIGAAGGWALIEIHNRGKNLLSGGSFSRMKAVSILALTLLILIAGVHGGRARLFDIQYPVYTLVAKPDLRASDWIRNNTPEEAVFLVNAFFAYGNNLIVGSDGGWWLPLTANRRTTLPPLTYGVEKGPDDQFRSWINSLPAEIINKGIAHPDVLLEMDQRGVDYLYIGQQQGLVNTDKPLLSLDQLSADKHFQVVYHQDRVWVFKYLGAEGTSP